MTGQLPAGLAEPLHIGPPVDWPFLAGVLAALLLAALLGWRIWRRWRRRRPGGRAPAPPPSPAGAAPAGSGVVASIEALSRRARSTTARRACHQLSALLREHLEAREGRPYSTLTAGEMERRLGEGRLARFFALLGELQFGRSDPSLGDVRGACDLALEIVNQAVEGPAP